MTLLKATNVGEKALSVDIGGAYSGCRLSVIPSGAEESGPLGSYHVTHDNSTNTLFLFVAPGINRYIATFVRVNGSRRHLVDCGSFPAYYSGATGDVYVDNRIPSPFEQQPRSMNAVPTPQGWYNSLCVSCVSAAYS